MAETLDFDRLSVAERIAYLQELWDQIAAREQDVEVSDAQRAELDRRLAAHAADPDAGAPWEEVRDSIRAKR